MRSFKTEVLLRSKGKCEGIYERVDGRAVRIGDCLCRGSYPLEYAHIEHKGMGGRDSVDTADNVLHLCSVSHALFDKRISVREYNRLIRDRR